MKVPMFHHGATEARGRISALLVSVGRIIITMLASVYVKKNVDARGYTGIARD